MQTAKAVLEVIHERGKQHKSLNRMYRKLYNPDLYRMAYGQIYANKGAMTKGVDNDTLDGTSERKFRGIIDALRNETFRWHPVRRAYIPKKDGRKRPLGIPTGTDKLLQAVIKNLLEAYYEPQFSKRSHGFRSGRGCHTALMQIARSHRDVSWFIEGDIKGFFDNVDHATLLGILGRQIDDGRFITLIERLLNAGYMEDWRWNRTYSGTPQGGIISPLLANIYLNEFDQWVEQTLLPMYNRHGSGVPGRKRNPQYQRYVYLRAKAKKEGDREAYQKYGKLMKTIPSVIDSDDYRKLEYVRYADDFLLSFAGPKHEAEDIKGLIGSFLRSELLLELSENKTLITSARHEKARFLGYELCVMHSQERRAANGQIWFGVPRDVRQKAKAKYMKHGKPTHRAGKLFLSDYDIVSEFQSEYRGLVNYYVMAHNIHRLSEVKWVVETSMLKTLANKHKSTVMKMVKRLKTRMEIQGKTYVVYKVSVERAGKPPLETHFGGIPLKRNPEPMTIKDRLPVIMSSRSQLIDRMLAEKCELCGQVGDVEVHHVKKLKDLQKPGRKKKPFWVKRMVAMRRKTLVVCKTCHVAIHSGQSRKEWNQSWNE